MKKLFATTLLFFALVGNIFIYAASASSYSGTINADKVFFRSAANTSSSYYAKLKKGDKVTVISSKGDFYKVTFNKKSGYVMKKFVKLSAADLAKIDSSSSNSKYDKIKSISKLGAPPKSSKKGDSGVHVEKLQRALQIKKFLSRKVDGKYGDLTKKAVEEYQKKNKLKATGVADSNTINHIWGKKVNTTAKDDPKMKGIQSISQIAIPNTTKPGSSGKHVTALQQALKLKGYFHAPIDGKYGKQTKEAVAAFQKSKKLKSDGVAGNETIKSLFGKNAANYSPKVESLDWFKGGSSVIPKGATFKVKDVWSGKTFSAKRWSGYNHLDAEPLDASSTATLKGIYKGGWSWRRRPIVVTYGDKSYAASMNGMPHEEQTIQNNDFNGHFCIHFLNSKTHGSNVVDAQHQNCVKKALNSR